MGRIWRDVCLIMVLSAAIYACMPNMSDDDQADNQNKNWECVYNCTCTCSQECAVEGFDTEGESKEYNDICKCSDICQDKCRKEDCLDGTGTGTASAKEV